MYLTSLQNLLSTTAALGVFWLFLIFGVCFVAVHIARLIRFGWLYQKQEKPQTEAEEKKNEKKEKAPEPKPSAEPVYYIVERKRKARQSYGEPKEIRFK